MINVNKIKKLINPQNNLILSIVIFAGIGFGIYYLVKYINNREGFQNGEKKIVALLASWCGHCKTFKPVINAFKENNPDINVKIHEDNKEMNQQYNVEGFPTVKLVKENGEIVDFNGPRTDAGLLDFWNSN
tara:strand:+ start:856 stop:1248 length:393 start_codon:yes stop_codon:yes gene_type:complete